MMMNDLKIANNYAKAFLNLYLNKLDSNQLLSLKDFFVFVKENESRFIELSFVDLERRLHISKKVVQKANLISDFEKLINLLYEHSRIFLLKDVIRFILLDYQKITSNYYFEISASKKLSTQNLEILKKYLDQSLKSDIIFEFKVDEDLIAGVRAISSYYLWENSVAGNLRKIESIVYQGLNESK